MTGMDRKHAKKKGYEALEDYDYRPLDLES